LFELVVDVALIVQLLFAVGAVNNPVLVIDPQVADHVTPVFAVNCVLPIACKRVLAGVIVTLPVLAVTVTVVDAVAPPLVAVPFTVQDPTVAGAV
jgi:hypothetical protein